MKKSPALLIILGFTFIACKPIHDFPQEPSSKIDFTVKQHIELSKSLPQGIVVDDKSGHIYTAQKEGGVSIYRRSLNQNYVPIKTFSTDYFENLQAMNIHKDGDRIYVALGSFFGATGSKVGLAVLNVSYPENATITDLWISEETFKGSAIVVTQGNYAFLGAMDQGIYVFDISNSNHIEKVSEYLPDIHFPTQSPNKIQHPNARGMAIVNNYLYLCYDAGGIRILDVENKKDIKEVGRYINSSKGLKQQAYNNIVVHNGIAYAAIDYCGMEVLDVTDPAHIKQLDWWNPWKCNTLKNNWFNSEGHTNQLSFNSNKNLVFLSSGKSELNVIDVSNPKQIKEIANFGNTKNKKATWGLTATNTEVLLLYIKSYIPFQANWSGITILNWKFN